MMAYQMANNQTIQQTLPPVADNRIIIVDVKYITEIPQDIIHANNIAQIKLMDGDVEVQDTENYTIQIDVKTGAVTIKKK